MQKEYIEREALEKDFNSRLNDLVAEYGQYDHYVRGFDEAVDRLEDAPAADVVEVRHAKWVSSEQYNGRPECPVCFYVTDEKTNYCPHCGCKMDREE